MVATITPTSRVAQPQPRPHGSAREVVPQRSAGRPTEDTVDLGSDHQNPAVGFGIDLAYGRQRHQVERVGGTAHPLKVQVDKTLSLDIAFDVQRLPSGKELDGLVNPEEKAALADAIDRVAREGLDSDAAAAFIAAVDTLFDEYADDLGLEPKSLQQARQKLADEVFGFFEEAESVAGSPLLKAPAEGEIYERYSTAVDSLRDRIERGRRTILEAAGYTHRALAEFAKDALEAREDTSAARLSGLGDFLNRLEGGRSADDVRKEARDRLLTGPEGPPAPDARTIASAKSFLAALRA